MVEVVYGVAVGAGGGVGFSVAVTGQTVVSEGVRCAKWNIDRKITYRGR